MWRERHSFGRNNENPIETQSTTNYRGRTMDRGIIKIGGSRHGWLSQLVLFALLVRALIPVGYMPDFRAAAGGAFKVVICSAYGSQEIAIDGSGTPVKHNKQTHGAQFCTFAVLAHLAMPAFESLPLPFPLAGAPATIVAAHDVQPPACAGPSVGSRAPPDLS